MCYPPLPFLTPLLMVCVLGWASLAHSALVHSGCWLVSVPLSVVPPFLTILFKANPDRLSCPRKLLGGG